MTANGPARRRARHFVERGLKSAKQPRVIWETRRREGRAALRRWIGLGAVMSRPANRTRPASKGRFSPARFPDQRGLGRRRSGPIDGVQLGPGGTARRNLVPRATTPPKAVLVKPVDSQAALSVHWRRKLSSKPLICRRAREPATDQEETTGPRD